MTCTNCVHFADCLDIGKTRYYGKDCACNDVEERCKFFKNKADFVEVVRCKDCKHFISADGLCDNVYAYTDNDDFCSCGERKDT